MAGGYGDQPQLSIKWALALCYFVGFRGKRLVSAVALMTAESGRYPGAWHHNIHVTVDPDGSSVSVVDSTDRGLFQINDKWHPDLSDDAAFRPVPNARYAADLSKRGTVFGHWAAYGGARYLMYYPVVLAVWALRRWESRVSRVEAVLG